MKALSDTTQTLTSRARSLLWLVTPALTGAVVMALELTAFRLYAPHFGYSIYVWGSLISVVMLALACGYGFGGWFADRCRSDLPLYLIILLSGVYQFLTTLFARPLLTYMSELGDGLGTGLATLILFAPPMIALAAVGPFVIRLFTLEAGAGTTAGLIYGLSTAGSIAGVLGTTFFLIPSFGTRATLLLSCAVAVILGAAGLSAGRRVVALACLPAFIYPVTPPLWSEDGLWVSESAYNLVRVTRNQGRLALSLNDEASVHTVIDETNRWTGQYYDYFALGPLITSPRKALVLGMGAGGSILTMRETAPDIRIDAVEIDEQVVEAGVRFFGIPAAADWLRIYVDDARPWLARCTERYDLIQLDMYQGGPYIPFYLATAEFFQLVNAHIAENGMMMMNVFDAGKERALLTAIVATLRTAFPTVAVLPTGQTNFMIFAFPQERDLGSIRRQFTEIDADLPIRWLAVNAANALIEVRVPETTPIFTDDHAAIEEMIHRMAPAGRRVQKGRPHQEG